MPDVLSSMNSPAHAADPAWALVADGQAVVRLPKGGGDVAMHRVGTGPAERAAARRVVHDVFGQMGPRSRYLRFGSTATLPEAVVKLLHEADSGREVVTVSTLDTSPSETETAIAFGSFAPRSDDPRTAEVDLAVADSWQGLGVGTLLVESLALQAQRAGIHRLSAQVAAGNTGARRLLRHVADDRRLCASSVVHGCQDIVVALPRHPSGDGTIGPVDRSGPGGVSAA